MTAGPLSGTTIIEMGGIGPAPFCGMMLSDHGARVIRVARPGENAGDRFLHRGRENVEIDLKDPEGRDRIIELCTTADGLIEGFRPGVMERLGLGPERILADQPSLVYGRMTGWGQEGDYAQLAGHDINYIALNGVLHGIGEKGRRPIPPGNLIGDFGGGGMLLAFGMLAGILHARSTGKGQVIDAAMADGASLLSTMTWEFRQGGQWTDERGNNLLDGGSHYYNTYETADGKYIAVGAVESQFYNELIGLLGLDGDEIFSQRNMRRRDLWPELREKMGAVFKTRTRDEWSALIEHRQTCFSPVLSMAEAPDHPYFKARGTFIERDGANEPAPAPRFSLFS